MKGVSPPPIVSIKNTRRIHREVEVVDPISEYLTLISLQRT
jgi:hypothetical protein